MKKAILIYNPTAGNGNHTKSDLKKLIEGRGFEVKSYSTDSLFWKRFTRKDADIIFVAGGDGTVQKLTKVLLEKNKEEFLKIPIQILPYGTANNIATTLGLKKAEELIQGPHEKTKFDIGLISGVEEASFFIEGMGCGIFPRLVRVMKEKDEEEKQDEIKTSLKELLKLIDSYEAEEVIIIADEEEITGKFLLVELMNIRYIGPNIELAPNANPGDGSFELVMVREEAREDLKTFIENQLKETKEEKQLKEFADLRKVREVRLKYIGRDVHIDDEILENYNGKELKIRNRKRVFYFLKSQ
ncbi:diacylglycerol/lipid kinase family protein [Salinimicrobium xinjiangense]|uniref:diacylglycerol/lipid kinase family protein n=1 Tax=Salinimicrobium xinjiangense TaxID=438596 RepID=UPI00146ACF48|nr:diacylglycerol kinase family protein [Salinimicrobium xinjiangense]